jgi:hypothetical protein
MKTMTTKRDEREREAGAPANLTQQLTKEQEGHDGTTSGGGAGQRSLLWSLSLPYRNVVAMGENDTKTTTTKCNERGREAGVPANLTQQLTEEKEGRDGATSGGGAGWRHNERGGRVAGVPVNATLTSGGGARQRSSSWLSSSPYRDIVAMGKNDNKKDDNKAQREEEGGRGPGQLDATTNQGKRGAWWHNKWRWCRAEAQQEGGRGPGCRSMQHKTN